MIETWLQPPAKPEDFKPRTELEMIAMAMDKIYLSYESTMKSKGIDLCAECSDELNQDEDDICDNCMRYNSDMDDVDNEHKGRD